ncbi:MAG: hypothetical protein ACI9R3_006145 [Verrucomicrobiales bacterium]|jgi:hypothetical protein
MRALPRFLASTLSRSPADKTADFTGITALYFSVEKTVATPNV